MTHFIPVTEYVTASLYQLRSEKNFIETVIVFERFLFLDCFEKLVCEENIAAIGEIPARHLERMLVSARAVYNGERRIELLSLEIERRLDFNL